MENITPEQQTPAKHPVEYIKIVFRHKWLLIIPSFFGLVLGIVACFVLPRTFESYTVVLVQEEKILNPIIQGLAVSTDVVKRMATLREQILGWNSLVTLTKRLELDKDVSNQEQFEDLILKLRKNIEVSMRGPMLIKISYKNENPQRALAVVQTLSDNIIEENMRAQTKESDVAINFIKEQLQVYKRKIKEAEIAKLEDELKTLLVDSTEMHPRVKQLREQIAAARQELGPVDYKPEETEQPVTSKTYETLKAELDKLIQNEQATGGTGAEALIGNNKDPNSTIYKLMLMDKLDSTLSRDINVNEQIYNMLLQKLETAKISQRLEVSKEGTRYTIIDPPRLPLQPIKPKKPMVLLGGLFLGAAAGIGLIFGREFLDQSFLDVDDIKATMPFPVLGAISRITTQEEVMKERVRNRMAVVSTSIISIVLIATAMLVSFLKK
jgi:uncharacterized protein involved in exopolysaccharide biosynthesis